MQPLGYLYKHVALRPDWLKAAQVKDIYSLSNCSSEAFANYINFWQHNGFWLFDSPEVMRQLSASHSISLAGAKLFYFEAYELEYDEHERTWRPYGPEPSFSTNVELPTARELEGFDVTTYYAHTSPECSPLSCNHCAESLPTNEHCLFRTFEEAKNAVEDGSFDGCEPGPYRIIAVYSVPDA